MKIGLYSNAKQGPYTMRGCRVMTVDPDIIGAMQYQKGRELNAYEHGLIQRRIELAQTLGELNCRFATEASAADFIAHDAVVRELPELNNELQRAGIWGNVFRWVQAEDASADAEAKVVALDTHEPQPPVQLPLAA